MNDKVIIKNLRVQGILGIYPEERVQKQTILINIVMESDVRAAAETELIETAVDYEKVSRRIIAHVESAASLLVERLATDIARLILTEFKATRVRVRVEKPDALPFAESVGIEIERSRSDFEA